jgi:hypothetical protein
MKIEHTSGITSITMTKHACDIYELHLWLDNKWPEVCWQVDFVNKQPVEELAFNWYKQKEVKLGEYEEELEHQEKLVFHDWKFMKNCYHYEQVEKDTYHAIWIPWNCLKDQYAEKIELDLKEIK